MGLFPKEEYKSTFDIPFDDLYHRGVRGVIFDIDNTLVLHDAPADERAINFIKDVQDKGFKTSILSNNEEPRTRDFANAVGSSYIYRAGKPKIDGYIKAMKLMGTDKNDTVMVGDQLFTDIWGANRAGVQSILVKRLGKEKYFHIVLKRILEAPVLAIYHIYRHFA